MFKGRRTDTPRTKYHTPCLSQINLRRYHRLAQKPRHKQPDLLPAPILLRINAHNNRRARAPNRLRIILEDEFRIPLLSLLFARLHHPHHHRIQAVGFQVRTTQIYRSPQSRENVSARIIRGARSRGVGVGVVDGVVEGARKLDLFDDLKLLAALVGGIKSRADENTSRSADDKDLGAVGAVAQAIGIMPALFRGSGGDADRVTAALISERSDGDVDDVGPGRGAVVSDVLDGTHLALAVVVVVGDEESCRARDVDIIGGANHLMAD